MLEPLRDESYRVAHTLYMLSAFTSSETHAIPDVIWGLPESERPVPLVLFVDEVAELSLVATRKDEERRDQMVTQLIRLAQLGRAAGIYLEVCGQRFGAELGKGATMLRAQLTGRVCHGVNDEASAKMALGTSRPKRSWQPVPSPPNGPDWPWQVTPPAAGRASGLRTRVDGPETAPSQQQGPCQRRNRRQGP
ncbi:plasmid transfer protein [Streptomyces azureus]|uniref:Plasmid transfer protein n=1 Tax=Streptomyces azureus TaxID=146537 RepID=A0A0K8PNL9_STRAJ|nr:plasmid transfer protein [Streptomyces azureus]